MANVSIKTSIAPWLSVTDTAKALEFYKAAFGAIVLYRMEEPAGVVQVAQLSIDGADLWISSAEDAGPVGGGTVRLILTVANPDAVFAQAIQAGATEIFPVGEDYGWRLGRLADPFGLHWEIGYQLSAK